MEIRGLEAGKEYENMEKKNRKKGETQIDHHFTPLHPQSTITRFRLALVAYGVAGRKNSSTVLRTDYVF